MTPSRPADWYDDPAAVGSTRYWNGHTWTDLVSRGGLTWHDSTSPEEVERSAARADARIVSDYLAGAARRGVLDPAVADALRRDVDQRVPAGATSRGSILPPPPAPPIRSHTTGRPAGSRPVVESRPEPEPLPVAVGQLSRWWSDARLVVRTDLALHGLAYLGVLLLFTGVTGLIAFSFGDVEPWVRTLAELLVPTALFVSAWYLSRRRATVVAASLTLLGGAISPIVVTASLTDGAPVPPDVTGRGLPLAQGLAVTLVVIAIVLVVRRAPESMLRFLVAPTVGMAAGLTAAVARDPVPTGYETARPDSFQLAVVLAVLAGLLLLCTPRRAQTSLVVATRLVVPPVAGAVFVLESIRAAGEGWPLAGTIIVTISALVVLETSVSRLSPVGTSVLQLLVVVAGGARLAAVAAPHWIAVGTAVALLGVLEYLGWRRPARPVTVAGLGITACAFLLTLTGPGPAATAFAMLTIWGLWRHVRPADWLPQSDDAGLVAAGAAVVTTIALWNMGNPGPALVVTAAAILLVAAAGRLWSPIRQDLLWRWFVPASAGTLAFVSIGFPWGESSVEVAVASGMAAAAMVLSVAPLSVRAWSTSAILVWTLANGADVLELDRGVQAAVLAAAGLALVLGSLRVASPICVDLATIGHVLGLGALAASTWPGWGATWVVAAATFGWVATAVTDERGEAVHLAFLRRVLADSRADPEGVRDRPPEDPTDEAAPLVSMAGIWATAFLGLDAAGWIATDDPYAASVAGGVAVALAWIVRVTPWRRARSHVLAWATLGLAVTGSLAAIDNAGVDRHHWSPVLALAAVVAVVGVVPPPRPQGFNWVGHAGGGAFTVYLADRAGLHRDWADVAAAAWGATALLGALALSRMRGHSRPLPAIASDPVLLPPAVLGAGVFLMGGLLGLSEGTDTEIGWTATGLSIVVLVAALLTGVGALVALTESLLTAAYVLLAPWDPLEHAWTFTPWALLLLIAALVTRRAGPLTPDRWDVPSFVVAHGVAFVALQAAADHRNVVATFALFGALAVLVALVLRRWPWAAVGAVLVLVAGADAGPGWLGLVLATEGVALTAAGLLRSHTTRWTALGIGAASLVAAWFDFVAWQSWSTSTVFYVTLPGATVIALLAAYALRGRVVPHELAGVWMITGTGVALGSTSFGVDVGRQPGGLTVAGALLLLAVATGLTARVVGRWTSWPTVALALTAWAPTAWALEASEDEATMVGTAVALVGLTTALAVHGARPNSFWLRAGVVYATATQVGAALAALVALPEDDLLIIVLVAAAAELVALGVLVGRPVLFVVSPASACGAWLLYARETLAGDANWFTVPIGLTVLVMVGLVRWIRRGRGGDPVGFDVVAVEFVGMSLLVASAVARLLAGHLWHGVLMIGIGVAIAGWGTATRVRRRAAFGATAVVLGAVLLMGVPLSRSITWRGNSPTLWVTLSLIGIAAIVAAATLEHSKSRVRRVARRLDEMTSGWERVPLRRTAAPAAEPGEPEDRPSSEDRPQPASPSRPH